MKDEMKKKVIGIGSVAILLLGCIVVVVINQKNVETPKQTESNIETEVSENKDTKVVEDTTNENDVDTEKNVDTEEDFLNSDGTITKAKDKKYKGTEKELEKKHTEIVQRSEKVNVELPETSDTYTTLESKNEIDDYVLAVVYENVQEDGSRKIDYSEDLVTVIPNDEPEEGYAEDETSPEPNHGSDELLSDEAYKQMAAHMWDYMSDVFTLSCSYDTFCSEYLALCKEYRLGYMDAYYVLARKYGVFD